MSILCVDFGSTFTKAVVVRSDPASVVATASVPTTWRGGSTDVMDGYHQLRAQLRQAGVDDPKQVLACSSAGGGLRLAVVGYERSVTAEAGHRVGLSAGAKVVHVGSGPMGPADTDALRASRPDIVLLVGGTDGGNAEVLLHNAARIAKARLRAAVVVAGNTAAAGSVSDLLSQAGRNVEVSPNVLPQIGVVAPEGARAAIRAAFLRHVIGGKGLSRGPAFASMVRAATPDAMLAGVEALAAGGAGDVLVVDVGGATTDVYSAIDPEGEDAGLAKEVVAPLWHARTVEADLGMRWNAAGIVLAAGGEGLCDETELARLRAYADRVDGEPAHVPLDAGEQALDYALARLAAVVAVRRHARAPGPGQAPRPLQNVAHLVGSGGVLRHVSPEAGRTLLAAVTADHGGGWKVPRGAGLSVDTAYVLFAAGLVAGADPEGAARIAALALNA